MPWIDWYDHGMRCRLAEVDCGWVIRSSLALLGNASDVERRRSLLNKDLKHMVGADFPGRGAYLFGEDFGKRAKSASDNISGLKWASGSNRQSGSKPMFLSQGRRGNWGRALWTRVRVSTVPVQSPSKTETHSVPVHPKQLSNYNCIAMHSHQATHWANTWPHGNHFTDHWPIP